MKSALFLALILTASAPADAATAFLQSCRFAQSVTYQSVYVGIYTYNGQVFERVFPSSAGWCPQTVEVY